ncbi:hypothetical protein [Urbifossiella limnaea]|uniref:Uncharacterized protein n=1 Tax=Urbifossiella limnaea TaxID=2528023 RepID=A0A517XVB5_9BACT|nr:hypothetical protein [Urbifossiella limnaea]QDU21453.1 hypothetical protein ETAA1_34200 [Urbifossiella limnaea]
MRGVGRRLGVLVIAAATGCATKPYDRDPLLSSGYGVRGDRAAAARPPRPEAEPATPDAPTGPVLGDRGLTSR